MPAVIRIFIDLVRYSNPSKNIIRNAGAILADKLFGIERAAKWRPADLVHHVARDKCIALVLGRKIVDGELNLISVRIAVVERCRELMIQWQKRRDARGFEAFVRFDKRSEVADSVSDVIDARRGGRLIDSIAVLEDDDAMVLVIECHE